MSLFNNLKKTILKTHPLTSTTLNVDVALKLWIYSFLKSFICLKWTLQNFSTTLHTQLNYLSRSVPLKLTFETRIFLNKKISDFFPCYIIWSYLRFLLISNLSWGKIYLKIFLFDIYCCHVWRYCTRDVESYAMSHTRWPPSHMNIFFVF